MMFTTGDVGSAHPDRAAASPLRRFVRKFAIGITGVLVILVGIPMIPLLGPGWLVVFTGLAILATEFAWAGRLRDRILERMRRLLGSRTTEDDA